MGVGGGGGLGRGVLKLMYTKCETMRSVEDTNIRCLIWNYIYVIILLYYCDILHYIINFVRLL